MARKAAADVQRGLVEADRLRTEGRLDDAENAVRVLLRTVPKNGRAWLILAKLLSARRDFAGAEQAYRRVIESGSAVFEARVNLGVLLSQRGAREEALSQYREALKLEPDHALALRNYGGLLRGEGALDEAVRVLERALALAPTDAGAHTNLGLALSALGRHERALTHLARAVELAPREALYHDNLLLLMHYSSELSREAIFAAHVRYGQALSPLRKPLPPRTPRALSGRTLRVGFVSADFRRHSVAFFLEPLLEAFDRSRFSLFAYSDVRKEDAVTARLKPHFVQFRAVAQLDDSALARTIQDDAIDVLIDLAGHTQGNRLLAFAHKPAPVQMSYLGYPNTTGLESIDFRITDGWADPEGAHDAIHTESLLRLDAGFLCYRPIENSPAPSAPPLARGAAPTFGSFNALAKISDRTLALWSRLLREVPEARLLIKHSFLSHPDTRRSFEARLAEHGIDMSRVLLRGHIAELEGHLAAYAEVDVALDTFPYHGTTTTCDALWMGVPVVSLAGDTHVSRVGVSLLSRAGLGELVAESEDAYVAIAQRLIADAPRLAALRGELRSRMERAGITSAGPVTRAFESALLAAFKAKTGICDEPGLLPPASEAEAELEVELDSEARFRRLDSGLWLATPRDSSQLASYVLEEQGAWFSEAYSFVSDLLEPGQRALDLGCDHGMYALQLAKAVGENGLVLALRPEPELRARLCASAEKNGFSQLSPSERLPEALDGLQFVRVGPGADLDAARALLAQDVLWLVERAPEAPWDLTFLAELEARGNALFRLVPGLGVLTPEPPASAARVSGLALFAARRGIQASLAARGLLAAPEADPVLPNDVDWREALTSTVLANRSDLARGFAQPTQGNERHQLALCAYALAQRSALSPGTRVYCLAQAVELARASIENPHELSRLMTLARVAWAFGHRTLAREALKTALSAVDSGRARIEEPFLPPSARYDRIDPGARFSDWVVSALLEQHESARTFSSYYDDNPEQTRAQLELHAKLGFPSPDMARRLALVRARCGA